MRKRNIFIACASIIAALSLTCVQLRAQTLSQTTVSNVTEQATLAGTATKNDLLTITIYDVGLSGGQKSVSTAVISGSDTLKKMATRLADGINADTALQAIGVSAIANENVLTIKSFSPNSTSYTAGVSNGATETISLAAHANPVENAVISGTPKATNRLTIRVFDSGLPTGQHPVDYIVQSGDTLQSIATSLATTNNNTGVLKSLGITATTAANVVTIKSYSPNQTTYTQSVTGNTPTETITLSTNQNSINDLVLSGPVVGGTNLTFGVQDVGLAGGQQAVAYTVQPNDTLASVSCGLASAVNTNANLAALGVRATCGGSNFLTVQSDSINQTNLLLVGPSVFCAPITIINSQPLMDDVKLCGTASVQSAQIVRSTLESIYGASAGLLDAAATLRLQAPKWYVYHDHPQYGLSGDSLFSHTGGPPQMCIQNTVSSLSAGTLGLTVTGQCPFQSYSSMFETDGPSGSIINKRLGHTTAHEAGHQLDFLYNPSSSYSHTAAIQSAIDRDIQSMNLIPACNFEAMDASGLYASTHTPVPAITGGLSGFFSGFTDSHGDQICNDRSLAAKYAGFTTDGTDNFKIMQAAFPYFKNIYTLPDSDPNHELFAEIFAVLARYSDLDDDSHNPAPIVNDTLIGQAFVCTYLAILKKSTDGTERTATELNSSGYAVPDSFGGAVYGPGTRVHSCDGAVQPIEYYGFGT